jgi:hypothetical protein
MGLPHLQQLTGGRDRERGAGLVLIIGVIAALAVSAATLVLLTANVQSNTSDTRQHVKSFTVTEAGLDAGMALLAYSWPTTADAVPLFNEAAFLDRFPSSEFPRPATGGADFIQVEWYDDQSPVDTGIDYDANGNGVMWMVAQAEVGDRATRLVSQVERTYMKMALPRGIPLWAGGDLNSNGLGNNPKIVVEVAPPSGTTTTVQVGGSIDDTSVTEGGISQLIGANGDEITPLDELFPPSLVEALTLTAQSNGRYFTSLAAAEASPVNEIWSPTGGLSGLTVIEPSPVTDVKIMGNLSLNSETEPGILMILGGSALQWGGTGQYYGVIYCEGAMDTSNGTADIHGMVITNSNEELKGTPNIKYNDNCIANLDNRFPSMARRVKNSWREVRPVLP